MESKEKKNHYIHNALDNGNMASRAIQRNVVAAPCPAVLATSIHLNSMSRNSRQPITPNRPVSVAISIMSRFGCQLRNNMASAKKSDAASIGIKLPRHCLAITAQKILSREVYQALFKFAFVRNPEIYRLARIITLNVSDPTCLKTTNLSASFCAEN